MELFVYIMSRAYNVDVALHECDVGSTARDGRYEHYEPFSCWVSLSVGDCTATSSLLLLD
jgi:hypothetical protein